MKVYTLVEDEGAYSNRSWALLGVYTTLESAKSSKESNWKKSKPLQRLVKVTSADGLPDWQWLASNRNTWISTVHPEQDTAHFRCIRYIIEEWDL